MSLCPSHPQIYTSSRYIIARDILVYQFGPKGCLEFNYKMSVLLSKGFALPLQTKSSFIRSSSGENERSRKRERLQPSSNDEIVCPDLPNGLSSLPAASKDEPPLK